MHPSAMDFFQSQDSARRRTGLLVFYYILAVILIIFAVYAVFTFAFASSGPQTETAAFWDPLRILAVAAAVLFIVGGGTLFKTQQLKAGGKKVARLLGGRAVSRGTKNNHERRLLNIVEEMSIASGVQVPQVFILDKEKGINAFAAGFSQDDAAIAVTSGCLETLSRDELQGVIAHEFSHILNGDMRLNVKLMGILFGIMVITFMGFMIFRSSLFVPRRRSSSRSGGGEKLAIIVFALALMIIGYIGVFFGKIIKSAVSRQREYLADASAVQFTRNPSGIAGALKKIANFTQGTEIKNPHAQEASHLFFANALSGAFAKLMATHPPLHQRISRIDPSVEFENNKSASSSHAGDKDRRSFGFAEESGGAKLKVSPKQIVETVGTTRPQHLDYASKVMNNIPSDIKGAAHVLPDAKAVIYALLFSTDKKEKEIQLAYLKEKTSKELYSKTANIAAHIRQMPVEYRIPLLDIAISTLKDLSLESYRKFRENINFMVEADGKISLFEYTVQKMILRHLQPAFSKPRSPRVRYKSFKALQAECRILLSMLAHKGVDDKNKKHTAFAEGTKKLDLATTSDLLPEDQCNLQVLDEALDKLNKVLPQLKKKLIEACVSCVAADGFITIPQAELIRITADAIGCPVPPIIPGKSQAG